MQQNKLNKKIRVYVINIKEICWRLLLQWKCILIFAVLMAALFTFAQYHRESSNAINEKETLNELLAKTPSDILSELEPAEQDIVSSLYNMNIAKAEMTHYIDDSLLMKIDPYHTKTVKIDILFDAEDNKIQSLVDAYNSLMTSDSFCNLVNIAMGDDYSISQIKELIITTDADKRNDNSHIATISFCLPEEVDSTEIRNAIEKQMSESKNDLISKIGPHSAKIISAEENVGYNKTVDEQQTFTYSRLSNTETQINNLKNTLTPSQQRVYDTLLKQYEAKTNSRGDDLQKRVQIGISKKYAILGFIFGVFLYSMIYTIFVVFRKRVLDLGMIEDACEISRLGTLESAEDDPAKSFFYDSAMKKKKYEKSDKPIGPEDTAHEIVSKCRETGYEAVVIMPDKAAIKNQDELFANMINQGVSVSVVNSLVLENKPKSYGVIMCIDYLTDSINDINNIIDDANRCDRRILGFICLS